MKVKRFKEDSNGLKEYDKGEWVSYTDYLVAKYQNYDKWQHLEKAIEHYQELTGIDILKIYEDNMDFLEHFNNK